MFESISNRIQEAFKGLRGEVRLTDAHIESALGEIRLALLEADVNFQVVKAFIDRVRDKATDQTVLRSLSPVQQVVKIVRDELLALFGDDEGGLQKHAPSPRVVLLLGLQGSGKTTTSGKLGYWLQRQGRHPMMVSTDVRRPAAIQQLSVVGEMASVRVYAPETMDPVARASGALAEARAKGFDTVIVDTAGRLHIDDDLMNELQAIKDAVHPSDLLYVADAMTGQDAIKSAGEFNRRVGVTGVVLTKLDGDARGGAALSVVSVVGVPIAFVGSGERIEDLELFHPDRIVSRMLGMGDMLSLIEKAEQAMEEGEAEKLEERLRKNQFSLEDFAKQLKTIKRMGPIENVLGMIPGLSSMKELAQNRPDDKQIARVEAIISSMTPQERQNDQIINGSRRRRIAAGSGTKVEDVNRLLMQFSEMKKVMKMINQGGPAALRHTKGLPKMAQGQQGFGSFAGGKKRKKGGPWGLIKSR
ncbi:MAG TPA: signal recognition particle protein [Vicinamibacterales bacterium]|jgi:signal recognition particle subunit SRP54